MAMVATEAMIAMAADTEVATTRVTVAATEEDMVVDTAMAVATTMAEATRLDEEEEEVSAASHINLTVTHIGHLVVRWETSNSDS